MSKRLSAEQILRNADTRRFKRVQKLIPEMSDEAAKFALLLINEEMRGYLGMPERQQQLLAIVQRSIKARPQSRNTKGDKP